MSEMSEIFLFEPFQCGKPTQNKYENSMYMYYTDDTTRILYWTIDISCLTRDRFVHHTLKYKRVFNGDVSK